MHKAWQTAAASLSGREWLVILEDWLGLGYYYWGITITILIIDTVSTTIRGILTIGGILTSITTIVTILTTVTSVLTTRGSFTIRSISLGLRVYRVWG